MKRWLGRSIKIVTICSMVALIISIVGLSGAYAKETVKIAIFDPQSGPAESAGRFYIAGTRFAVEEQNAKGGLLGRQIELFAEDGEMRADVAIRKAKKLILKKKINFMGGGASDAIGIALNQLATDYKVIHVNYTAQAMELNGVEFSRYGFRTMQSMHNLVNAMALTVAEKGYKRFYTMAFDLLPGHQHVDFFIKAIKKHIPDAEFVGEEYFPMGNKDFGPYISKMLAANPEVVMLGAFGTDMINMIKQSRKLGYKGKFLNHAAVDPYLMKELGDQGEGIYYAIDYSMDVKTPANEQLVKDWHAKHKSDEDFYLWWPFGQTGQTVIGWRMIFAAVEKAGSLDPEKIIETLEGFRYESAVGPLEMRACDHQVLLPMFGGEMKVGKNAYFNGSIRTDVDFPWESEIMTFSPESVAFDATEDYNPRCK